MKYTVFVTEEAVHLFEREFDAPSRKEAREIAEADIAEHGLGDWTEQVGGESYPEITSIRLVKNKDA